jgi:hypothetical protein
LKRPLPLATLLDATFSGKPAEKRIREARVWEIWDETVGPQIASKAQPATFRDGTLTVRVTGSAWMQQLSLMKQEIIRHLNESLGAPLVTDIFFKQGSPNTLREKNAETPPPPRKLSEAEKKRLAELTESVDDPELRDALISLFASRLTDGPRRPNP